MGDQLSETKLLKTELFVDRQNLKSKVNHALDEMKKIEESSQNRNIRDQISPSSSGKLLHSWSMLKYLLIKLAQISGFWWKVLKPVPPQALFLQHPSHLHPTWCFFILCFSSSTASRRTMQRARLKHKHRQERKDWQVEGKLGDLRVEEPDRYVRGNALERREVGWRKIKSNKATGCCGYKPRHKHKHWRALE